MTGDDARILLGSVGRADVLAAPFASLDLAKLDAATATRWRRESARRPGLTVDQALTALSGKDRQRLALWLWESYCQAPEPVGGPRVGMPLPELVDWARSAGLEWALHEPCAAALADPHWAQFLPQRTVAELVSAPEKRAGYAWVRPAEQAAEAVRWLRELDRAASARAREQASFQASLRVDPGPPFTPIWRRYLARYLALLERHRPTMSVETRMEIGLDPPALTMWIGRHRVVVTLEAEPPSQPWPQQELAVCEGVLAVLAAPSEARDRLATVVGKPRWQRDLDHLASVVDPGRAPAPDKPLVAWEVTSESEAIEVYPSFCRLTKAGKLQGKRVEARELMGMQGVGSVDAQVASLLQAWRRAPREVILEALELLSGHPRVILKGRGAQDPIPVRSGPLLMVLRAGPQGVAATFTVAGRELAAPELEATLQSHDAAGGRAAFVREQELLVARCTVDQRRLALAWTTRAPTLPPEALPQLLAMLPRLQERIPVSLGDELRGRPVEGDARPLVRLRMEGASLVLEVRVAPLPDAPEQEPGEGPETLHVVRDGAPRFHTRDLREEPARVRALLQELGVPETARQGPWLYAVDDHERALDVVRALDPGRHRVETDAALPLVVDATTKHLRLKLDARGLDWFGVSGRITTEGGDLALGDVLEAVRDGRRYVPMGKNRFVRLEAALVARARALDAGTVDGAPRVGGVHAPLLEVIEQDGGLVEGPEAWRRTVTRLRQARDAAIELPDGLRADLREYQREGFTWLARQAAWAPGAVLADDMGLGKTVQAIALLLRRSEEGPALVVAPTSVVFNWTAELARFAPGLRVRSYLGAGREQTLAGVGKSDVLLTTYGVLVRDAEALAGTSFATLVLDESQALKNPDSQRAKAARGLKASFRLALSGTPVENHAAELWSLFSILVPSLFGSLNAFRSRFLGGDERANRSALAQLAGPFMLRRTKRQVAPELPERQEITQLLDLEDGHRALYATGVEQALARIATAEPRVRHFVTGQELMRLRQLSCDPRLADPGCPWPGPKVRWLRRSVAAVRESGEQALVFSSYVSLLELARTELAEDGARIAWLTGSTSPAARKAEVERFQAGEADVFLLSLKAGGTGLNLTAASYVFVLDPWFNPAAEDQAADRAHRIGQDKKVTIYRGVARGTVEEKILELQADKRELVDALLAGSGSTEVLSPSELLLLLSGAGTAAPATATATATPTPTASPPGRPRLALVPPPEPPPAVEAPAVVAAVDGPDALGAWLAEALVRIGSSPIAASSAVNYRRALEQFVAWCRERGVRDRAGLAGAATLYKEAAARGEVPLGRARMLSAAWSRL